MNNKRKSTKGYWLLYRPNHPYRTSQGYVPEARVVMEKHLGRFISPLIEDVHHRDEDVQNNVLSNLMLLTKSEHRRLHSGWEVIDREWWKTCGGCNRFLQVDSNFYKRHSGNNEYVTMCKDCVRQISASKRPPKLSHEERCVGAHKAVLKGWETRRCNKGGD